MRKLTDNELSIEEFRAYCENALPPSELPLMRRVCGWARSAVREAEADRFSRDLCQALNEGNGSYKP